MKALFWSDEMNTQEIRQKIENYETSLGIELGSTRIKVVLIDDEFKVIAAGESEWENELNADGFWTYSENIIWSKLQEAYANLLANVKREFECIPTGYGAVGFSAMMHGYIALDKSGKLLVPFRTWRNGNTDQATKELSKLFNFNIPHRWSIAHLHQAILNKESHLTEIDQITTLAGYVHWKLTGEKVLGVGDASGMFPIDSKTNQYNQEMIDQYNDLVASGNYPWKVEEILPNVLLAGENAGTLTEQGATLLDPTGSLKPGIPMAPPEGDAGTGMVATDSIKKGTANVSAGTSAFAMVVLDKELSKVYPEIDIVTTPAGAEVAMVHINNCTSEINYWMSLFKETFDTMGIEVSMNELYEKLFNKSLEADQDIGQLLVYGFHSGENIINVEQGRPMIVRNPNGKFNLANFIKANLYSAFAVMKIGMDTLLEKENIEISETVAHGGIFKTPVIAQSVLAAVMKSSVTVMDTASEGGAWGMAILASYIRSNNRLSLEDYLDTQVFKDVQSSTVEPTAENISHYEFYIDRFVSAIELSQDAHRFL